LIRELETLAVDDDENHDEKTQKEPDSGFARKPLAHCLTTHRRRNGKWTRAQAKKGI
jgi:hypothetical protein